MAFMNAPAYLIIIVTTCIVQVWFQIRLELPVIRAFCPAANTNRVSKHRSICHRHTTKHGEEIPTPPTPRRDENHFVHFGVTNKNNSVADPYGWMRDDSRTSAEVLHHIEQENAYTAQSTRHLTELRATLEEEYKQYHTTEVDIFNVYFKDEYIYYSKRIVAKPYAIHCRTLKQIQHHYTTQLGADVQDEDVLLDENLLLDSNDDSYLAIHSVVPSPSNEKVAYSVDTEGNELYTIYVKAIDNDSVTTIDCNTSGNVVWGETDESLHYVRHDSSTMFRPCQWMEWKLIEDEPKRQCHRNETDDRFWCHLKVTTSRDYVLWICDADGERKIWAMDTKTGAMGFVDALAGTNASCGSTCWCDVDHGMGAWWMIAGCNGTDVKNLYKSKDALCDSWTSVAWTDDTNDSQGHSMPSLESLKAFQRHMVLYGRHLGQTCVWILEQKNSNYTSGSTIASLKASRQLDFEESAHYVALATHQYIQSNQLIVTFESTVTPQQTLAIDLDKPRRRTVLYKKKVPGYNESQYTCSRFSVPSRDGKTHIPISVTYKNSSYQQRPCPAHLLGYGAYGHALDPSFSAIRLSLLNRGVVCVVAHVRGGGELGRQWHHDGSHMRKQNSIHDFVDVAKHLIDEGWTTPDMLGIEGRSAGGVLIGGAMNEAPELFRSALLVVPFLDPLIAMSDPSLPLTSLEYQEWGNPQVEHELEVMKQWSPMQSILSDAKYPSMLALGGLNDNRAPYWEPLKYVATLRHESKFGSLAFVKVDSNVGHSVGGNQTKYFQIMSDLYAFFLDQVIGIE